jgi:hypothetical protein
LTTTTGALNNTGAVSVDGQQTFGTGGSSLVLGGALTNGAGASFEIGNISLTATSAAQAASLSNAGTVNLEGNGAAAHAALTLAGGLTNTATFLVDAQVGAVGGSTVTVGGTLDNSGGTLTVGNSRGIGASTTLTATGLSNTGGTINLIGNTTNTANQATVTVNGQASNFGDCESPDRDRPNRGRGGQRLFADRRLHKFERRHARGA